MTTDTTTLTGTITETMEHIPHPKNFTDTLISTPSSFSDVSNTDIFIVIFGAFILSMFIAFIYKQTFKGKKYNQNYVQSLVMLAVIIALVMLLVGSNIARAFTMAGALSIIRFRNNIKDTRDIGFLFFALAIGMAMWTQFYMLGFIWTICIWAIFYFLFRFNIFKDNRKISKKPEEQSIEIEVKEIVKFNNNFKDLTNGFKSSFTLQRLSEKEDKSVSHITYNIKNSWDVDILELIEKIKKIPEVSWVKFIWNNSWK